MRAGGVVLVSFAVSVAVVLASFFFVFPHLPVSAVEVPSLRGMTAIQARGILDPRGLRLVLEDERPCADIAAGTICEQHPLADSRLPRGGEVRASVAQKTMLVRVPRVAGMTVDAARTTLANARLRVSNTNNAPSSSVQGGLAIGTEPAADVQVAADSAVVLTVATEMKPVPSLYGKHLSTAKQLLEASGFQVGVVKHGNDDDRDPGEIISQTPKANEQAAAGTKIDVVVNE